jgi:starvation-inducible DNA-binding protein
MKPNIGLSEKNSLAIANYLAKVLADEYVLYTKTRNAHWNVEGADFYDKHKFFEGQYEQLDEIIDEVAERIRKIGHYATASLKIFLENTRLTEVNREKNDSEGFIRELLADHESIIIYLREIINPISDEYKDVATTDFLTGVLEDHEKMAWFLRAHLK